VHDQTDVQVTLEELDWLIRSEHPGLYRRFRPGLSDEEIEGLGERLRPYYLPAELLTVYRWHGGWLDRLDGLYRSLLPDAYFLPFEEAIEHRRSLLEILGTDGWHPLWIPAFGEQFGELVALQLEPCSPAGGVFSFHSESELHTSYDSVAALFGTTLECWREGLLPDVPAGRWPDVLKVTARHNPLSRARDGVPRQEVSRSSTKAWPATWKDVLGIGPMVPAPDELVATIVELDANGAHDRPIRAELRGRAGSADIAIATATDATGSVNVFLTRDHTENFREFQGGRRYEMWLVRLADREDAERADDLSRITLGLAVDYLATRIVRL
jgi:cell wall assembly regulator SMI1